MDLRTSNGTLHFRLEGNAKCGSMEDTYFLFCKGVIIELCVEGP